MGTQAMGSHGGGRQQVLPRQGSMYNLTLNEVQDHLGEPLLGMNLDDLLRNVLPPEGEQQRPLELDLCRDAAASQSQSASASGIQRQGSVNLRRALSKKTVDEVWKDIQRGQNKPDDETGSICERQATLGEMTLEDFLMKAGAVAEDWDRNPADNDDRNNNVGDLGSDATAVWQREYSQGTHWLQVYPQTPSSLPLQPLRPSVAGAYGSSHPMPLPLQAVAGGSTVMDVGYSDQMAISSPLRGTLSDSTAAGRKRVAYGDIVEKTVERRQKRMIKNRESAARSRARKQAYTNELENKVSRLEEENELLKKQQELDRILYSTPIPEPKFRLRRTSSAPL